MRESYSNLIQTKYPFIQNRKVSNGDVRFDKCKTEFSVVYEGISDIEKIKSSNNTSVDHCAHPAKHCQLFLKVAHQQ